MLPLPPLRAIAASPAFAATPAAIRAAPAAIATGPCRLVSDVLIGGAYVSLTENSYKITYKDMVFSGEKSELAPSFLPLIIFDFIFSFEGKILLDSYDK